MRTALPTVRPIAIEIDAAGLALIERCCFDARWTSREFQAFLDGPRSLGFVALANPKTIAGYVLFEVRPDRDGKERLQLIRIAVHPRHQLRGVGSMLLRQLKSGLRSEADTLPHQRRRDRILCEVSELSVQAQTFLKKNGFIVCAANRNYFTDGGGAIAMEFRLTPRSDPVSFFSWRRVLQR